MRLNPKHAVLLAFVLAAGTCYHYFFILRPQFQKQDADNGIGAHYSFGGDFYPVWLTGRALLSQRTNPYTQEMTASIQAGLYGRTMDPNRPKDHPAEYRAFAYPLYTDLLAAPLLPFRFETVRVVLAFVLAPLTAGSVVLWLRALRISVSGVTKLILIILTLATYPVLEGIYMGQVALLTGAALALSMEALTRSRLALCGTLLALASVKPQMVWLIAIFALFWSFNDWKQRNRLVISFVLTSAVLLVACEILVPRWLSGWFRILSGYSAYTLPPLPELVLGKYLGSAASLLIFGFALAVCWKARRLPADSTSFAFAFSFILAATTLLLPSAAAAYDQLVLLPAILWLWSRRAEFSRGSRAIKVLALAGVVALSWQWIAACVVSLLSFVAPEWARSPAAVFLPMRTEASFPFAVVALMAWCTARRLGEAPADLNLQA